MKYDFDNAAPDRRGSGSYKWDSQPPFPCGDASLIPMWVADMDFRTAPCVIDALRRRVEHGVFGYTFVPDDYHVAVDAWFRRRHGYGVDSALTIYTSGVVPALSAVIKALAAPGKGVIVQTPVYNCFFSSIRNNACRIVDNPLLRIDFSDGSFAYEIDFDGLERLASEPDNVMLLLCNPHNPAGRLWSRDELMRMADICRRHGLILVSDEIHCDLTLPGSTFTSVCSLPDDVRCHAVVCTSPSKAFNTAGLQIANIFCGNEDLRALIDRAINDNEVCDVNPFGVAGLIAAYTEGESWLEELTAYIKENYEACRSFMSERLPELPLCRMEASYLVWIDTTALGMDSDAVEELLLQQAGVWINSGIMYGADGYIRINIACPRRRMMEGLERIAAVLRPKLDSHV